MYEFPNKDHTELKSYVSDVLPLEYKQRKNINYTSFLSDKFMVMNAVKKGITSNLFQEIKSNSLFNDQQWSDFLHINIRTLQRYNKEKAHVFKPLQSEKIFEMAEVMNTGFEVFDTPDQFNIWLNSPSVALGNEKPINLLHSSFGIDLVLAELSRIEHGVFV
ncbi:MAG: antitoxin Xre/MbcA/ParS toxin-binding domain-containing protein [Cryomorphaceae bacterium]|nr:DUF2384 domain-containing protein [Flavobacteriales bacterium]